MLKINTGAHLVLFHAYIGLDTKAPGAWERNDPFWELSAEEQAKWVRVGETMDAWCQRAVAYNMPEAIAERDASFKRSISAHATDQLVPELK